jgi:hypothetical protein
MNSDLRPGYNLLLSNNQQREKEPDLKPDYQSRLIPYCSKTEKKY